MFFGDSSRVFSCFLSLFEGFLYVSFGLDCFLGTLSGLIYVFYLESETVLKVFGLFREVLMFSLSAFGNISRYFSILPKVFLLLLETLGRILFSFLEFCYWSLELLSIHFDPLCF